MSESLTPLYLETDAKQSVIGGKKKGGENSPPLTPTVIRLFVSLSLAM